MTDPTQHRDRGAEITRPEVESSLEELKVLQAWFAKEVLRADEASGSTAVLILPVGPEQPDYRDAFIPPSPRLGVDALGLASFIRMPQLVVPSTLRLLLGSFRHQLNLCGSRPRGVRLPGFRSEGELPHRMFYRRCTW